MKDPYLDEETGILRNLLGARTVAELNELEAQIVFANEIELESCEILKTGDFNELLAIHEQLFKGVFDWAGEIRIVDIKKNSDDAEFFLPKSKIITAGQFVSSELGKEKYLTGLNLEVFIKRLAYHYDQINYIHPFREGNGRAQRIFWSRIATRAGFEVDWAAIEGEENNEASRIAAEEMDIKPLEFMFSRIVKKAS